MVLPPGFPFGGMENPRLTFATPTIIAGDLSPLISDGRLSSWPIRDRGQPGDERHLERLAQRRDDDLLERRIVERPVRQRNQADMETQFSSWPSSRNRLKAVCR